MRMPGLAGLLAVTASAAVLCLPGTADAGSVITRQASAELPAAFDAPAIATARCPKGSEAISGGWAIDPSSTGIEVYESRRISPRRWRVSVVNAEAAAAARLTTFAYCDRSTPHATVVASATADPGAQEPVWATCPRGREATAGGFLSERGGPGQSLLPLEFGRVRRRSWEVVMQHAGFAPSDLTVFAYCTPHPGSRRRTRRGSAPLTNSAGTALTGRCPKRPGVRSGGFEIAYQTGASKYGISESRRVGRRWRTIATILAPSAPDTTVTSRAYCH